MIAQWMKHLARALLLLAFSVSSSGYAAHDPLPSWNDGPAKQSIIDYVTRVTKGGGFLVEELVCGHEVTVNAFLLGGRFQR